MARGGHGAARIHDLRHSFAVRRLLRWHEQGVDVHPRMLALSTYMGHAKISNTYWYLTGVPELMQLVGKRFEHFVDLCDDTARGGRPCVSPTSTHPPSFAALAQAFFTEHLQQQRAMSPRTVAAYRDAFVLFLQFAQARLRKQPTAITLQEITPSLILAFLDHLEHERGNAVRSAMPGWRRYARS